MLASPGVLSLRKTLAGKLGFSAPGLTQILRIAAARRSSGRAVLRGLTGNGKFHAAADSLMFNVGCRNNRS
jgi:hypothetical protein